MKKKLNPQLVRLNLYNNFPYTNFVKNKNIISLFIFQYKQIKNIIYNFFLKFGLRIINFKLKRLDQKLHLTLDYHYFWTKLDYLKKVKLKKKLLIKKTKFINCFNFTFFNKNLYWKNSFDIYKRITPWSISLISLKYTKSITTRNYYKLNPKAKVWDLEKLKLIIKETKNYEKKKRMMKKFFILVFTKNKRFYENKMAVCKVLKNPSILVITYYYNILNFYLFLNLTRENLTKELYTTKFYFYMLQNFKSYITNFEFTNFDLDKTFDKKTTSIFK